MLVFRRLSNGPWVAPLDRHRVGSEVRSVGIRTGAWFEDSVSCRQEEKPCPGRWLA